MENIVGWHLKGDIAVRLGFSLTGPDVEDQDPVVQN